ncbi:hypothetical protein [Neisseria musculi]|uniref:Uncharacterized protein n=1 Tax=Neisseria musculi TaxID=1815583 RepID=A0A7H1M9F3_9NEIS|nr:hypothetical protein [Neisseria musculi]QNT58268.1 hypothetical protein H7A79_0742 [Neisseria musculi]
MDEVLNLAAMQHLKPALFDTGTVVSTTGLHNWAQQHFPAKLLMDDLWVSILVHAHIRGVGWDDLPGEDGELNRSAIQPGKESRIMSVYEIAGEIIWIITEWDRSVTTLLFPHEY